MGQRTSNVYDAAGRMVALVNPRGYPTTSVYDSRDLKTENIDPLGRISTSQFDAAGRQILRLDGRAIATTFSYDENSRNTGRAYPDGSLVTFVYDAVSNRTEMKDSTGAYSYQYTRRNRMESASSPDGRIITYGYDSIGLMTNLTDSAGRAMTYQYDAASRLKTIEEIDGGRTTFSYDSASRRTLKQMANGTRASSTYNSASQLIELANLKSDNSVLSDFQFGYDHVGNRLTTLENTGDRVTWTYDAVYQLTDDNRSGNGAYKRKFQYDANGNRVKKVANTEITNSTFDGADQLSTSTDSSGVTNYSYDDNGNQSLSVSPSGERTTSTWGYENQVGLVALPSGQLVTSAYNADNRRVSKVNDDGVINFNWDPVNDNVLLETDETDAVIAEYTNVPVPFGEPLSQNRSSVLSFFHFDGNYSTRQLTDISEVVTDSVIFTGYGEEARSSGSIIYPFGYKGAVGYYTDSATGNIYVRARTYQPIIGRWLSMDPLGFVDGPSLYRAYFVPGTMDPGGLMKVSRGETGLWPCGGYVTRYKYTAQKIPKGVAGVAYIQKICVFRDAYVHDCKNTDGCCEKKERKDCKPCCYIELLGYKKSGVELDGDQNEIGSYTKPGCSSQGSFIVTANVRAIDLMGHRELGPELKKLVDNTDKEIKCVTGCGLGVTKDGITIGPHIETSEDGSRDPNWWTKKIGVLDEANVVTKTTWSCCGRVSTNWQITKFHDQTYYWCCGGDQGVPIDDPPWH